MSGIRVDSPPIIPRDGADDVEVSVVMPCLDEARTVGRCVAKALQALNDMGVRGEVIVADNGSTDGSPESGIGAGRKRVPPQNPGRSGVFVNRPTSTRPLPRTSAGGRNTL